MTKRRFIFGWVLICCASLALTSCKQRSHSIACANQMHAILYVATREWPTDHDGLLPTNFISMSNDLIMPKLLVCPGDHKRRPATNWSSFNATNCSYEMISPGLPQSDTNTVFIRCPIHAYRGYADDRLLNASGKPLHKFP